MLSVLDTTLFTDGFLSVDVVNSPQRAMKASVSAFRRSPLGSDFNCRKYYFIDSFTYYVYVFLENLFYLYLHLIGTILT